MIQGAVGADFVVICTERLMNLAKRAFVPHNHAIQTFSPDRSYQGGEHQQVEGQEAGASHRCGLKPLQVIPQYTTLNVGESSGLVLRRS